MGNGLQKLHLTSDEFKYITNFIQVKNLLLNTTESQDQFEIQLSEDQLDDLEEIFSERLQIAGFDIDYNPTDEGRILEALLDKLSEL